MNPIDTIEINHPSTSEFERVGELIYIVDPFIYPALFGSQETARSAMPDLMGLKNSPFAPEHIYAARLQGWIAGILVLYTKPFMELPVLSDFYENTPALPASARNVCDEYLLPMCAHVASDSAYIPCIATDQEYRGMGIASKLILHAQQAANGKPLTLDVLYDNESAIRLYKRHGFVECGKTAGYSYDIAPPKVLTMSTEGHI